MPYNPQKDAVVVSKPFGAVGFPIDSRSFFYDEANFVRRAFISIAEVLAYFDTPFKREGMFYVFVNSTGTLQPNGTILGGTRVAYWWKEGTADNQLIVVAAKGDKGDKGDAFTFDDFTLEEIELLQQPAIDAAEIADIATNNANIATGLANTATNNANIATTNANTATSQANTARDSANAAAIVANNARGWSPLFVGEADGIDREVWKLDSWINGTGTAPTDNVGLYLKSDGTYTAVKADAANYKGEKGNNGIATPNINAGNLVGRTTIGFGSAEELAPVGLTLDTGQVIVNYQNAVTAYNASSGVDTPLTNAMSPLQMFQNLQKQMDARMLNTGLATNLVLGNGTYQALSTLPAFTATKLATSRNINGVAFDGTANITVADSTKEPTANKSITLTSPDDIKFPTTKAVSDALALKAPLASPTFTGTVGGITKSMVGLSNVDNTADTAKPVSTAQQTALDLKANINSPSFTGTPSLPTGTTGITQTAGDNSTKLATTAYVKTAVDAVTSSVTLLKGSTTANGTDVYTNRYKDITVTGAAIGDVVNIDDQFRLLAANVPFWISAKVTATNTVRIYFSNLQLYFDAGTTDASSILNVYTGKPIENPSALAWTINYTIIK